MLDSGDVTVLEIIAERCLGRDTLAACPGLRAALRRMDQLARDGNPSEDDKAAISSLVELCAAYEAESDPDERANILRTLEEISANRSLELPAETIEKWEERLSSDDQAFAKARSALERRRRSFQKKYFSFRARAGLQTQEAVAKRSGLRRSYVAVIEAGAHFPQQKTLQKLAKAFNVDVAELLT
jgi:DNA-binding XRE family transcriptional regulator